MKYKKSLFVFRRDYRLDDNTALIQACKNSEQVILCFLFEKTLLNPNNLVFSEMRIRFMIDSLKDLFLQVKQKNCNLLIKNNSVSSLISSSIIEDDISAIFMNKDNSPYGRFRDNQFKIFCDKNGIAFEPSDDLLLSHPGSVLKDDGTPFLVFTPFYHAASKFFGSDHSFISELYWRDFFTHLMYHFPYSQKKEFQKKFQNLKWSQDRKKFEKWSKYKKRSTVVFQN